MKIRTDFVTNSSSSSFVTVIVKKSEAIEKMLAEKNSNLIEFQNAIESSIQEAEIDWACFEDEEMEELNFSKFLKTFLNDNELNRFIDERKEEINAQTEAYFYVVSQFECDPPEIMRQEFLNGDTCNFRVNLDDVDEEILTDVCGEDIFDKLDEGSGIESIANLPPSKLDRLIDWEELCEEDIDGEDNE